MEYPKLNRLINLNCIPEPFGFVRDFIAEYVEELCYNNLQWDDADGSGYYEMDIIPANGNAMDVPLFNTGLSLIIFSDETPVHIQLQYILPILAIMKDFSFEKYSGTGKDLLDIVKTTVYIPDNKLLSSAISVFEDGENYNSILTFINRVNDLYDLNGTDAISIEESSDYQYMIERLLTSIMEKDLHDSVGKKISVLDIVTVLYLNFTDTNFLNKLKVLFYELTKKPLMDYIKDILSYHVDGSVNMIGIMIDMELDMKH